MSLKEILPDYIAACFTGLWIQSHEHEEAIREMAEMCSDENWQLCTWDIDRGLSASGTTDEETAGDPLSAVKALQAMATLDGTSILVLQNYHKFLGSPEIIQALATQISHGKQSRTFVVILSPVVEIPTELEKQFVVIEHQLPSREQLESLVRSIATEEGELPEGDDLRRVLDAAAGLTRFEAEGAFSLSLVRHGKIAPGTIWELKCQALAKSGLLQLYRSTEGFETLGGLDNLKTFCRRSLLMSSGDPLRRPRGVLLLGVPGTGKSAFAKALGKETGRPTLTLDVGALMGSMVGQTESNIRQALKIADAMEPCILFMDEVEKALSGVGGSSDSGVASRLFGTLLSWLNDHTTDVYVVATCNDISKLPPEFSRAERFDAVAFLDLPSRGEKEAIWQLYHQVYSMQEQPMPVDTQWTGAEIKACCRLAAMLDVPLVEAAKNVVPVAVTASENVDRLRSWASGRCLSANSPGIFTLAPKTNRRRNVKKAQEAN